MSGFVCLHRDALGHPLLKDPARLGAWFWLVARAAWKPTPYDVNGKIITVERGQLCVSIRQLSDEWKWPKSTVERFLTRLKTETMIETASGTGKLVITICNYAKYQDISDISGTANGTASGTGAGQERDTKEQGNKGTIVKDDKSSFVDSDIDDAETPSHANPKITASEIDQAIADYRLAASRRGWPEVRKVDAARRAKLSSRLKENGLEGWREALGKAMRSEQLGRDPPGWFNFRWLTQNSENILKVLEGNYDKRFGNNGSSATPIPKLGTSGPAAARLRERFAAQAVGQDELFGIAGDGGQRLVLPAK